MDETGAKTNGVRFYGRAPVRLVAALPDGHWMTATFVAALRHDEITAPCVFDGPANGASFLTYAEQFPVPTLRNCDAVVIDNPASHKAAGVRQAIERAGATSNSERADPEQDLPKIIRHIDQTKADSAICHRS